MSQLQKVTIELQVWLCYMLSRFIHVCYFDLGYVFGYWSPSTELHLFGSNRNIKYCKIVCSPRFPASGPQQYLFFKNIFVQRQIATMHQYSKYTLGQYSSIGVFLFVFYLCLFSGTLLVFLKQSQHQGWLFMLFWIKHPFAGSMHILFDMHTCTHIHTDTRA